MILAVAAALADDHLAVAELGEARLVAATWSGHPEVWWVSREGAHATAAWPDRAAIDPGLACGRAGCLLTVTLAAPVPAAMPSVAGWLLGPGGDLRGGVFFGPGTRATPVATRRGFVVLVEEPTVRDPAVRAVRLHAVAADGAVSVAQLLPISDALGGTVRPDPDGQGATWVTLHGEGRALRFGGAPTPVEAAAPDLPQLGGDPPRVVAHGPIDPLLGELVVRAGGAVAWIGRGNEPGPDGTPSRGVVHAGAVDADGVVAWSVPLAALGRARTEWVAAASLDFLHPDRDGRGPAIVVPVVTESAPGRGQAELLLSGPIHGEAVAPSPPDDVLRTWAETGELPPDPGLYLHLREEARGPAARTSAQGAARFGGQAFGPQDGPCGAIREVIAPFDGPLTVAFERGEATFVTRSAAAEGEPGRDGERRLDGAWEGGCAPAGGEAGAAFWLRWQTEREPAWFERSELGPTRGGFGP